MMWRDRIRRSKRIYESRRIVKIAKLGFLTIVLGAVFLFLIFPLLAFTLPSPEKVVRKEGFSTKILDRNGKILYDIFENQRRTAVTFENVPLYCRQATIAIEDKNFYTHQGFDPTGMVRGLLRLFTRGRAQGGSTLTQQLVKNVLLSSERTIFRKIREFILAVQIEKKYSKDEILLMYLNEAPYGGTAWGIESAAETYFGKKVQDLNLVECAILAGLPQRPSYYSPYSTNPKAFLGRTEDVLRRMKEDDYIRSEQEKTALEALKQITFLEKGSSFKAPHFVSYVQKILEERYGADAVELGGLKVTTTLDLDLQEKAQTIVAEEIAKVESVHITNGAVVVLDPQTGEILSMVGSKNFSDPNYDGQVNVTLSSRQPGSAIKPFTYVTAFKKGYTASTLLMDVPTEFPGGADKPLYIPVNYDGKYRGPIQVRYALGNSINIPAVKMLAKVGIRNVLQTAFDLGLSTLEPTDKTLSRVGLSLTLGGGEVKLLDLTTGYSGFLNKGYRNDPVSILKVEDRNGKVLEKYEPKKGKKVLSDEQAFLIADILSDNEARKEIFGLNSLLYIPGRKVAVKTGTTNDRRDNWAIGGDPQVVVGVWVGNNDNTPMKEVASGVSGASPIWRKVLLEALKGKQRLSFEIPSGIVNSSVDIISGYRAHDGFPERMEYFISGTEPGEDPVHMRLKVCKSDGRLAAPGDIASGNFEEKEYFLFKEEDPTAQPGEENKWQKGILTWLSMQGDWRYHPPTDYCGSGSPVSISFLEPQDRTSDLASEFNIRISADSTSNISEVALYIDGERIRGFTNPPYEHRANLLKGVHKITAKAKDVNSKEAETTITIGVGLAWDYVAPTPTPTLSPLPTPSP